MKKQILGMVFAAFVALVCSDSFGVPVERNDSIVYMTTNLFLNDNSNTPLHVRIQALDLAAAWTNGLRASVTNTIDEIVEVFIEKEGWQGRLGIYDPTNGHYRIYPNNGIVRGFYADGTDRALLDGYSGDWVGGYSNATKTVYASNLVLTGVGPTVLGRDVRSKNATSVGQYGAVFGNSTTAGVAGVAFGGFSKSSDYGAAFGSGTDAGFCGAAFGSGTDAGDYGAAFGQDSSSGSHGAVFGKGTTAGNYGAAFGSYSQAGGYGFAAGTRGMATNLGSFVFADRTYADFDRGAYSNSFSVRASGGTYFDTPELVVTGAVTATKFYLRADNASWLYSDGTNLYFATTAGFTNALTSNTP